MERLRRKRPSSNPNPGYSSGNEMFRNHPKPASIYDEHDDLLTFELGMRSRKPTPMKKLLAKEMCRDRSSSPGVVAQLMGLDALPPPPPQHHTKHKTQTQTQTRTQRHKETTVPFKDVYEVPNDDDMAFIRQKFTDAKRLARHHHHDDESSQEFRDALHVLDSNRHLLLRYLDPAQRRVCHPPRHHHRCCHVSSEQPTRIVVLKPNVGKISRERDRKDTEVPLVKKREIRVCERRSVSREIAKEITRQMRLSASSSSKGYAADESSCSSGNESPPKIFSRRSSHSHSHSHSSGESLMSREGKKRLSDRWKMNHSKHGRSPSESIRATSSRGSTLAEMLAVSEEKESKRSAREDSIPLGISSRDGWKDSSPKKLTRSMSLPNSSAVFGSPKAGEDRYVSVSVKERKKSRSRSNSATSFPCPYLITQRHSDDTSCPNKPNSLSVGKSHVTADMSPLNKTLTQKPMPIDVEPETATMDERNTPFPQEPRREDREDSPVPMDRSVKASETKESDQPSPVSVLAPPFSDDPTSSPDCFESLSADLQGLRMQLQLLKLESESYENGDMVFSSDDEEKSSLSDKNWEICYAIEALVNSTLDDDDPELFVASWHARDSPIGPQVFEALEEKEQDYEHHSKCERKLLFDRINEAITEIHERSLLGPNELQELLIRSLSGTEEAKKEMAEIVQSQWLNVRCELEIIASNIQKSLFDELVAELLDFAY